MTMLVETCVDPNTGLPTENWRECRVGMESLVIFALEGEDFPEADRLRRLYRYKE